LRSGSSSDRIDAPILFTLDEGQGLRVRGEANGPLGGFGPSLNFDAHFAGTLLRVDLRYEEEGRDRHDVLLWTPDAVFLFDRVDGGVTELGGPDGLDTMGERFALPTAFWLLMGRWPSTFDSPPLRREGRDLEGVVGGVGLWARTVQPEGSLVRSALRWESDAGEELELSCELEAAQPFLGGKVPLRARLDGDELELEVLLSLSYQLVENVDDTLFDPLKDP